MVSPIKVYLDSNVVIRLLLERDTVVERIAEASKKGCLQAFVSWLSLMEISNLISGMSKYKKFEILMRNILEENRIRIFMESDSSLSSANVLPKMGNLDYGDYLHLQIAARIGVGYFVTYDRLLISEAESVAFKVLDPRDFVEQVLKGRLKC